MKPGVIWALGLAVAVLVVAKIHRRWLRQSQPTPASASTTAPAPPPSGGDRAFSRRVVSLVPVIAAALVLSACAPGASTDSTLVPSLTSGPAAEDSVPPTPQLDAARLEEGEALYGQYCASCHGADLSGDPEWKTPNADGSYRPPPHDSSGHTWHHSDRLLMTITRDGSDFPESRMPPFGDTLTDEQITAIFEFIKASWEPQERDAQWRVTWGEEHREQS